MPIFEGESEGNFKNCPYFDNLIKILKKFFKISENFKNFQKFSKIFKFEKSGKKWAIFEKNTTGLNSSNFLKIDPPEKPFKNGQKSDILDYGKIQ